jgi:soluble lytic murein transglycosylase
LLAALAAWTQLVFVVPRPALPDPVVSWHVTAELRRAVARGTASAEDSVRLAAQELALGRPERARALLNADTARGAGDHVGLTLLASAEFAAGNFERAGELFLRATALARGEERGVFTARAAAAFARAEWGGDTIAALYREAARRLPPVAGWLAVREAQHTTDPVRALALLRRAPPMASRLASRTRATVLLASGDSLRALNAFGQAEDWGSGTRLATALGDTLQGRHYAVRALEFGDTVDMRAGLAYVRALHPSPRGRERYVLASALRQLGQLDDAVAVLESAVATGDSAAATLRRLGDLLSSSGKRARALDVYELAAGDTGSDAALAAYRRGRILTRLGQANAGYDAFVEFAEQHPGHANAPGALVQVAEWHRRGGRVATADSILTDVAGRWPDSEAGSQARMTLAADALARHDTAAAMDWYRAATTGGTAARAAQYLLADLQARSGDSAAALQGWRLLAARDSLGYYGTIARRAAVLDAPRFAPAPQPAAPPAVAVALRQLDLLVRLGFEEEADEVVRRQLEMEDVPPEQTLPLAAGLVARGWVSEGVRLGWRATRQRSLNDEQVLRVIFPWPLRELIESEAREHELDPHLLAALIRQESAFRPTVVSHAGAHGLMQLMPATASWVAGRHGIAWDRRYLTSAAANLHVGAVHLAALLRTYDGDVVRALAAYNAGATAVRRWLRYPEANDAVRLVERIPYVETRGYIRTVLRNWDLYRGLYPVELKSSNVQ